MTEEKRKFSIGKLLPLAIILLIVCELIRNLYFILTSDVNTIDVSGQTGYIILVMYVIFMRAIIPAGIDFVLMLIAFRILARRGYSRVMKKQDFYTITMLFTSAALFIAGAIDLIAFANAKVFTYTSAFSELVLLFAAYVLEYFLVLAPKLTTAKGKYSLFKVASTVFLVWEAISTLLPCVLVIEIYFYKEIAKNIPNLEEVAELFAQYTYAAEDVIPCIIAVVLYAAMAIFVIVYSVLLAKASRDEVEEVREQPQSQWPPQQEQKVEPEKDPFEEEDDWEQVDKKDSNSSNISDIFDD